MMRAATLNDQGVDLLEREDYTRALKTFKSAAELMYQQARSLSSKGSVEGCDQESKQACHKGNENPDLTPESMETDISQASGSVKITQAAQRNQFNSGDGCFLYSQAFRTTDESGPELSCEDLSMIILFNMGLAYHLSSFSCSSIPFARDNAISLYSMACSLAMKAEYKMPNMVMACLNNLGFIHFEMSNFEKARSYLDDLTRYISMLQNFSGETDDDVYQRNLFLLNAMLLREPHGAAAA